MRLPLAFEGVAIKDDDVAGFDPVRDLDVVCRRISRSVTAQSSMKPSGLLIATRCFPS